jgi:hypothetical protein
LHETDYHGGAQAPSAVSEAGSRRPALVCLVVLRESNGRPQTLDDFAAVPKVRILADYCSPGYQLACDQARAFRTLPVDDDLLDRLAEWAGRFETCDPRDFEDVSGARFDFVAFAAEGLEIARAVKRALPHWTVLYWDDSLDWFLARDPRSYRPARSEYEVTLKDAIAGRPRRTQP